ncbi:MAG: translocation and assembly module lipoprotein TamL, partial [Bacteroidia bacterium]
LFRNVLIQFVKNPKANDMLDCYIICTPLVKQSVTFETEATNTSGNLGIAGNLLFQNKNFFKGAELVELKLNGSVAAQKQFKSTSQDNINNVNDVTNTFNTLQFGPELKFSVPRAVFPFSVIPFKKDAFPRTFINTSLNYQSRPEFSRVITSIDYGFSFKSRKGLLKHDLIPVEVYSVKAKLQSSFKDELTNLGDYFLLNSFIDHITTLSKYSITYNNQQNANNSNHTVNYLKVNVASSGNILRGLFNLTNQPKDTLGRYKILNVPFAQFLKLDFDYRLYVPLYKKSRLVYRFAAGAGKSLANLNVLPYEQSFFSGGPNSVRAWRARTLGPGGYAQPSTVNSRYDKIGDLLLEGNFEYRFHVFKDFYGAFFADAGNVWLLHKDPAKPLGDFEVNRFYKEIALGSGLGIRWDLSFIVVRVDAAIPIRDPKYTEDDRWTFNKKPFKSIILNFGIGYPF